MSYHDFLTLTTGQILTIVDDKAWWMRRQAGEREPRTYTAEEAEREKAKLRAIAQRARERGLLPCREAS